MNFCWVTLHVNNFDESLQFYHEIFGLPIDSRHDGDGIKIAMLGESEKPKVEILWNKNIVATPGSISAGCGMSVRFDYTKKQNILKLLADKGFTNIRIVRDLSGNDRIVVSQIAQAQ